MFLAGIEMLIQMTKKMIKPTGLSDEKLEKNKQRI